jgi:hypothetical protein
MYYHIPPSGLYQEYQARVADAERKALYARSRRPAAITTGLMWRQFRAWLATERDRIERALQPAEEGYIA